MLLQEVAHTGLQPAEAEIVAKILQQGSGKVERLGISFGRQSVHQRTSRVRQSQELSRLVEAFPSSVIEGSAEDSVLQRGRDQNQQGVAATDNQGDIGLELIELGGQGRSLNPRRVQMRLVMVDPVQRTPE